MSDIIVSITDGQLLGKQCTASDDKVFYSFQGIPYAKPPIGPLRFKAPQKPESWSGVRNATKEAEQCYSRHQVFKDFMVGAEDCLYLNVYTPSIAKFQKQLKPVMVWIHGGGFTEGSGNTDLYGPEYLLTEDIVLVTINYRLGILGFLQFDDDTLGIPGNAGLKDMVLALQWVQANIVKFGGDASNVTIFGESAGGSAVHYLVLSPLAKGLFHKCIAQSGTALNVFARGRNVNAELAEALKLSTTVDRELLEVLVGLPVEELFTVSEKVIQLCDFLKNAAKERAFAPVIEAPGPGAFITEEPIAVIRSGNYSKVPMMFGYTTREGMLVELKIRPLKPRMPPNFEDLIPFYFNVEKGTEASETLARAIKEFYYGEPDSEENPDNFYLIHTDNYFLRDIAIATYHHAVASPAPVFLYRMSIDTAFNFYKKVGNLTGKGACHGDDIGYLFKTQFSPVLKPGSLEEAAIKRFVKLWTNFAKNGDPSTNELQWEGVSMEKLNFVDIGQELTGGVEPDFERLRFWNGLLKTFSPSYAMDI